MVWSAAKLVITSTPISVRWCSIYHIVGISVLNKTYYYLWCVWSSSFRVIATKRLRWRPSWKMAARGTLHHMPSSHHRKCWSAHFSGSIDLLHNYPSLILLRDTVRSRTNYDHSFYGKRAVGLSGMWTRLSNPIPIHVTLYPRHSKTGLGTRPPRNRDVETETAVIPAQYMSQLKAFIRISAITSSNYISHILQYRPRSTRRHLWSNNYI